MRRLAILGIALLLAGCTTITKGPLRSLPFIPRMYRARPARSRRRAADSRFLLPAQCRSARGQTPFPSLMTSRVCAAMAIGLAVSACAGRDPAPVASVQPQDVYSDCTMIRAEIEANNAKAQQLADEKGLKVAQNVAAGVVGLVIWPVWFAMDSKGAASTEATALQARQQYLTTLATERCAPGYRPPLPPGSYQPPAPPPKRTQ